MAKLAGVFGLVALGGVLVGCAEDVKVPDYNAGPGTEAPVETTTYPDGPFGYSKGSVVPNLKFYGFHNPKVNSDLSAMEYIDLAQFYNPTGTDKWPADSTYRPNETKPKVLWLDVSAQWCGPCQLESQTTLPNDYPLYQPQGLEVILELIENLQYEPAEPKNLIQWTTKYKTAWPAVIDPARTVDPLSVQDAYPQNILIDTKTMKIIFVEAGASQLCASDANCDDPATPAVEGTCKPNKHCSQDEFNTALEEALGL